MAEIIGSSSAPSSTTAEQPVGSANRKDRFPALDGLRAVGALAVVTTHAGFHSGESVNGSFAGLLARLDVGVPIFFVVSGYLLYRPHALARMTLASPPRMRRYFLHRALRILPALWIAVLAAYLLLPHDAIGPVEYLYIGGFVQVYSLRPSVPGLTQMWSLTAEVAFYLLLPLLAAGLAWVPGKPRQWSVRASRALLWAVPVSLSWIVWSFLRGEGYQNLWLPAFIGWFGLGMILAVWNVARGMGLRKESSLDHLANAPGTCIATAGALYLLMSTRIAGPYDLAATTLTSALVKNIGYAAIAGLLVLPAINPKALRTPFVKHLGTGIAGWLGDISYGIFAYHLVALGLVELFLEHEAFGGDFLQLLVGTLVLTIPMAWLSYRFIERPVMMLGRGDTAARPRTAAGRRHVAGATASAGRSQAKN
ncbi:acyltransferase family protein [Intrasporangium calvum]|uniref:Acyltransferase 3 n=1 Tax=Intrasporangium calvum (strain ATCC 23552 / DSM 43043 / JCM 3097 / NBRC 12989 / NCIMB 10167 / NRRL B-3866 / 7 KIP) TaxID=710696 RepID=E6S9I0_INTC7|nr:acyltransferase [Intrasporangium calvum]ADU48176.1 acyltransferase 3 [Intrasporangium calvum DSM 43043]